MVATGIPGDEVPHDLIAHEALDERTSVNERIDALAVEAIHHIVDPRCAEPFGHRRRAANIGEQSGQLDLGAAFVLHQPADAHGAIPRVLRQGPPPKGAEHGSEWAVEGRRTDRASWRARQAREGRPFEARKATRAHENCAPDRLVSAVDLVTHRRSGDTRTTSIGHGVPSANCACRITRLLAPRPEGSAGKVASRRCIHAYSALHFISCERAWSRAVAHPFSRARKISRNPSSPNSARGAVVFAIPGLRFISCENR